MAESSVEREIWIRVKHEYKQAFLIAESVWPKETPPEVIQSATATLLIHHKDLQKAVDRAEQKAAAPERNGQLGHRSGKGDLPYPRHDRDEAPTECPECGGEMWDNRGDKKNPKSPDLKCKDPDCGKAIWLTPPPKRKAVAR